MSRWFGGKRVFTIEMTVQEWARVADNPIQRDTEQRAQKAVHLFRYSPAHAVVHAYQTPQGKLIKLDGHTRAYLWALQGKPGIPTLDHVPKKVTVVVYPATVESEVEAVNEAAFLYQTFDQPSAAKDTADTLAGIERKFGVEWQSTFFVVRKYASALRVAFAVLRLHESPGRSLLAVRDMGLELMFESLLPVLREADSLNIKQGATSFLVSAILITLALQGEDARQFWTAFLRGEQRVEGRKRDVLATFRDQISKHELRGMSQYRKYDLHVRCAISAVDLYAAGNEMTPQRIQEATPERIAELLARYHQRER